MNEKLEKIKLSNPREMSQEDLRIAKNNVLELFKDCLPYKAENGIGFNTNGVSLTTREGLIFADNYGKINDSYAFMLRYSPTFSPESKYHKSIRINKFDESALEQVSKIIKVSLTEYADNLTKGFLY